MLLRLFRVKCFYGCSVNLLHDEQSNVISISQMWFAKWSWGMIEVISVLRILLLSPPDGICETVIALEFGFGSPWSTTYQIKDGTVSLDEYFLVVSDEATSWFQKCKSTLFRSNQSFDSEDGSGLENSTAQQAHRDSGKWDSLISWLTASQATKWATNHLP